MVNTRDKLAKILGLILILWAKADPALRPLEISYPEGCVKRIANTGNSWKANVDDAKASK